MSARLVRYAMPEGVRAAIVTEGRTRMHAVVIDDGGVREVVAPLSDLRYCTDLPGRVDRAARRMLNAGRSLGISKAARAGLRAVLEESKPRLVKMTA